MGKYKRLNIEEAELKLSILMNLKVSDRYLSDETNQVKVILKNIIRFILNLNKISLIS